MVPQRPPRLREQASSPTTACPSCPTARGHGRAARLDRGHRHAPGRDRAEHPKVKLIANALGTPPADMIERDPRRRAGSVAALCGSPYQAAQAQGRRGRHHHRPGRRGRRPHRRGRLDRAVARGRSTRSRRRRCSPPAASAPASRWLPRWRWAAQGVWTRLAVADGRGGRRAAGAEAVAARRRAAATPCGRRSFTGKPCRMLRNDWTEAWERPDNPEPLGMPLQYMVTSSAVARGHQLPRQGQGRGVQPGRPGRRPDEQGPPDTRRHLRAWSRSTSRPASASPA